RLLALVIIERWWTPAMDPARLGMLEAVLGSLQGALAFVLSQGRQEGQDALADGRRQVEELPVERFDGGAAFVHALHDGECRRAWTWSPGPTRPTPARRRA